MPILTDDGGKVVTLKWPHCLQANRITKATLPEPLVYIGTTSVGVESRQLISTVPHGASLDLEMRWISESDDGIDEFYEFWFNQAVGTWNVFTIDDSNIPCLIPGWNAYKKHLPSQLWRMQANGNGDGLRRGLEFTPSGCCAIDFNLTLVNILLPDSSYTANQINQAQMITNLDNPINSTPKVN